MQSTRSRPTSTLDRVHVEPRAALASPPVSRVHVPYVDLHVLHVRTAFTSAFDFASILENRTWNQPLATRRDPRPSSDTRIASAPTSQVVHAKNQPSCGAAPLLAAVYLWSYSASLVGVPGPVHSCQVQILLCADTTRTRTPASSEMSLRQALLSSLA